MPLLRSWLSSVLPGYKHSAPTELLFREEPLPKIWRALAKFQPFCKECGSPDPNRQPLCDFDLFDAYALIEPLALSERSHSLSGVSGFILQVPHCLHVAGAFKFLSQLFKFPDQRLSLLRSQRPQRIEAIENRKVSGAFLNLRLPPARVEFDDFGVAEFGAFVGQQSRD